MFPSAASSRARIDRRQRIDATAVTVPDATGRPVAILPDGKPITELVARKQLRAPGVR